jgi:prepilin-type N-terminal cleavage/methylation domain-containing protein
MHVLFPNDNRRRTNPGRAFTLIELLIVVAIIGILAAIALPNFLEAQIRAKVSRAKSDLRTLASGVEQYRVDWNCYPEGFSQLMTVTTPVAYLTSLPRDPFLANQSPPPGPPPPPGRFGGYRYGAMPIEHSWRWAMASVGPDNDLDTYSNETADTWVVDFGALGFYPGYSPDLFSGEGAVVNATRFKYITYDPTNGTVSNGDLFRLSDHQL